MKATVIKKKLSAKDAAALRSKNTKTLLGIVDEALTKHGSDLLSVDKRDDGIFAVNICAHNWSDCYKNTIICSGLCDIPALIEGLNQRHVGYCF